MICPTCNGTGHVPDDEMTVVIREDANEDYARGNIRIFNEDVRSPAPKDGDRTGRAEIG